jgi:hypothetical protein
MKIIDGLYSYYSRSRRVGHTSAAVQGIRETVESGRKVIFVTMNRDFGDATLRGAGIDVSRVIVATPEDFKRDRFAGMEQYPMVVDNHVMYTLLSELEAEVEKLRRELSEERRAYKLLAESISVLAGAAIQRVIGRGQR